MSLSSSVNEGKVSPKITIKPPLPVLPTPSRDNSRCENHLPVPPAVPPTLAPDKRGRGRQPKSKLVTTGKHTTTSLKTQQDATLYVTSESSQRRTDVLSADHYTCPTCAQTIVEANDDREGQEALFCEGNCNTWYHRWCAGVSTLRYEALSSSEEPFLCPTCTSDKHQQSIFELQSSVKSLLEEVCKLKVIIATLQKSNMEKHPNLNPKESVTEDPTTSEQWSLATGRSYKDKCKIRGKKVKQDHIRNTRNFNIPGCSKQRTGVPQSQHSSVASNKTTASAPHSSLFNDHSNLTRVTGARRIWGTMKSCTVTAIRNAISRLCPSLPSGLRVRRKFKTNGEKTRWWFIVHAPEQTLSMLEEQWGSVKVQTSWSLEPCFAPTVSAPGGLDPTDSDTAACLNISILSPTDPPALQPSVVPDLSSPMVLPANRAETSPGPKLSQSQSFLDK